MYCLFVKGHEIIRQRIGLFVVLGQTKETYVERTTEQIEESTGKGTYRLMSNQVAATGS